MADFAEMRACVERALAYRPAQPQEPVKVDGVSIESVELERELEMVSA